MEREPTRNTTGKADKQPSGRMEKEKPFWQRIYQEPAFTEVARIIGYAGTTYRDLMEKVEPLKTQFGGQAIDSAIYFLASFEGDKSCNVKPLAHVQLREDARRACFQLLGFPPEYKEVSIAEMLGLNKKPEPPKTPDKKPKPRKKTEKVTATTVKTLPNTPIMQQYREAKEKHPDMILLFRVGDFYEVFDEDAETLHKTLGLTLTTLDQTVSMAGFPHHQLEAYLHKLLKAGLRVAICDQVEESLAKGPIKREVQRVVVPNEDGDVDGEPA
jgi:hypothetical protein